MKGLRRLTAVAAVVALFLASPAAADDLDEDLAAVDAEIAALLAEIGEVSARRSGLAGEIAASQAAVAALRAELAVARQSLEDSTWQLNLERVQLDKARAAVVDAHVALAAAADAVTAAEAEANAAVQQLYIQSGHDTPSVVLTSESLDAASLTIAYLSRVSDHAGAAVTELEHLQGVAAMRRELVIGLEADVDQQVTLLDFVEQQRAAFAEMVAARERLVGGQLAQQRSLLNQVDDEIALFEGELAGLEKEQAAVEALIAVETAVADGAAASTAPSSEYARPVPGAITSWFGPRLHPILGFTRMHSGVDMTAPHGQAVRALTGGRVILASSNGGYGNTVILDHGGGLTSLYAHQSSFNVTYGDVVERGDVVGYAGSSGLATGPHLHFEVRINGSPVDPAPYLAGT